MRVQGRDDEREESRGEMVIGCNVCLVVPPHVDPILKLTQAATLRDDTSLSRQRNLLPPS